MYECISMYLYNIYNITVERSQAMVEMQGEVTCLSEAEGSSAVKPSSLVQF